MVLNVAILNNGFGNNHMVNTPKHCKEKSIGHIAQ